MAAVAAAAGSLVLAQPDLGTSVMLIAGGGIVMFATAVALFVTLIPTTIGALLSAIGIAGMDRLVRFNVLAMSGRAVEAAGGRVVSCVGGMDPRREQRALAERNAGAGEGIADPVGEARRWIARESP